MMHHLTFFWKQVTSILSNSPSISLLSFFKLTASTLIFLSSSSTVDRERMAALISSMSDFLLAVRFWATNLSWSILEQCSMAMIFSCSRFSSLIFFSFTSFSLCTSSCCSLWMTVILLSSLVRRWDSSEYILLMRLLKQVLVLSQMPLKNIIEAKSYQKSWIFSFGSQRCRMLMISSFLALFISSASRMISSFREMMPLMSLPSCCTLTVYISMISVQMSSILLLERAVISSMKSLMASLADQDRMFWMCLDLTNCISFITFRMPLQASLAQNWLLPALPACLKSKMRFLNMRKSMKSRSSSLKRKPFSFFSWIILRISL